MSEIYFSYYDENMFTREKLIKRLNNGESFDVKVFYEQQDFLSQFYLCKFNVAGVTYSSVAQYVLARKAEWFRDEESLQKILKTNTQYGIKRLGRRIKNINQETWDKNKMRIAFYGNAQKFNQNEELKNLLLATGDAILVYANPFDKVCGIGASKSVIHSLNPSLWEGENLLGFILMEVREQLKLHNKTK